MDSRAWEKQPELLTSRVKEEGNNEKKTDMLEGKVKVAESDEQRNRNVILLLALRRGLLTFENERCQSYFYTPNLCTLQVYGVP